MNDPHDNERTDREMLDSLQAHDRRTYHTDMQAHGQYAPHRHEVRADHRGVPLMPDLVDEYAASVTAEIMQGTELKRPAFEKHVRAVVGRHLQRGAARYAELHGERPDEYSPIDLIEISRGENPDEVPAFLTPAGHVAEGNRLLWIADQMALHDTDLDAVDFATLAQAHFWSAMTTEPVRPEAWHHPGSMPTGHPYSQCSPEFCGRAAPQGDEVSGLIQGFARARRYVAADQYPAWAPEDPRDDVAAISTDMSDLEIAGAVIRVVGYERLIGLLPVLSDAFNAEGEQRAEAEQVAAQQAHEEQLANEPEPDPGWPPQGS